MPALVSEENQYEKILYNVGRCFTIILNFITGPEIQVVDKTKNNDTK